MNPATDVGLCETAPSRSTEQNESTTKAHHILVVDDDTGIRSMLAICLRRAGYRVSCAEDGEAGWEALCTESFDAVITDHEMPRLTGLELLRRVRATPRPVPVILISGKLPADGAALSRLLSPGLAMQKPFSMGEFMARVRSLLTLNADAGCTSVSS